MSIYRTIGHLFDFIGQSLLKNESLLKITEMVIFSIVKFLLNETTVADLSFSGCTFYIIVVVSS